MSNIMIQFVVGLGTGLLLIRLFAGIIFSRHDRLALAGVPDACTLLAPQLQPKPLTAPSPAPRPLALGARGATPVHYRAFSLLRPRLDSDRGREVLIRFRERAKTIKLQDEEPVRYEALRLLDRFVQIADEFTPLFDRGEADARTALEDRLSDSMEILDGALEDILQGAEVTSARFDQLTRFVEIRYAPGEGYGLSVD